MDKKLIEYFNMGTGGIMDPIRPMKFNTIKSRVANLVAYFEKTIKKHPGGFTIDKNFFLSYLRMEKLTGYTRKIFKRYGYKLRVYSKKPYVLVEKI